MLRKNIVSVSTNIFIFSDGLSQNITLLIFMISKWKISTYIYHRNPRTIWVTCGMWNSLDVSNLDVDVISI